MGLSATDYVEAACLLRCSFQREEKNHSNNTTRKGLIFLKAEVFRVHIIHTGKPGRCCLKDSSGKLLSLFKIIY